MAARGDLLLCLNPDIVASPDIISRLVEAVRGASGGGIDMATQLRWNAEQQGLTLSIPPVFTSPYMRHLIGAWRNSIRGSTSVYSTFGAPAVQCCSVANLWRPFQ